MEKRRIERGAGMAEPIKRGPIDEGPAHAVLFAQVDEDEAVRIECAATEEGGLVIMQESEGPLTQWCFEESPHRVEVDVDSDQVQGLLDYFHLEACDQLPAVLRLSYVGYDAGVRIRELMRRLGVAYRVHENPVIR